MRRQMFKLAFLSLVIAVALSGCGGSTGPDLVPVKASGKPTFCQVDESGYLWLYVKNQGGAEAASSEVEVEFFNVQPGYSPKFRAQGATGPLKAGETSATSIYVEIPEGCFNPDCNFKITVDILNEVKEDNEQNNSVEGACTG